MKVSQWVATARGKKPYRKNEGFEVVTTSTITHNWLYSKKKVKINISDTGNIIKSPLLI